MMASIYLLLFNAPVVHLNSIHNVYTDGVVKSITWKKHLADLTSNWQEYVLYVRSLPTTLKHGAQDEYTSQQCY